MKDANSQNQLSSALQSIQALTWNVKSGGFEDYSVEHEQPQRGAAIQTRHADLRNLLQTSVTTLTDAHRWDDYYGGNSGIARHLGYREARFVRLNDGRLDQDNGAGIGILLATDHRIQASQALDLGNRQALGTILDVGKYGLQFASVYLDDLSEDVRRNQITGLLDHLEPGLPTILTGDFNALRPSLVSAKLRDRLADLAVKSAAVALPVISKAIKQPLINELAIGIPQMNQRLAYKAIIAAGYQDADAERCRPTAPSAFPAFGIDYAFAKGMVELSQFKVHDSTGASDHQPISYQVTT